MIIGAAGPNGVAGAVSGTAANGNYVRAAGAVGANGAAGVASSTSPDGTINREGGAYGVNGEAGFESQVSDGTHTGEAGSTNFETGAQNSADWSYNPASGGNLTVNGTSYTLPPRPVC